MDPTSEEGTHTCTECDSIVVYDNRDGTQLPLAKHSESRCAFWRWLAHARHCYGLYVKNGAGERSPWGPRQFIALGTGGRNKPPRLSIEIAGWGHWLCADSADPAAAEIINTPPNTRPESKATAALARAWIGECATRHSVCSPYSVSAVGPKRLLRVMPGCEPVSPQKLKLVDSSTLDPQPPYAALSYCWGGSQTLVLSHDTHQAWLAGMEVASLPQTIKDAVAVMQSLGMTYLWIDALCILQDDADDKLNEIANMAGVYERAHITVSAARSAAVGEGFLQPRHVAEEKLFQLPYVRKDGTVGSVVLVFGWPTTSITEPIDLRGWTYQESALARRTLEYGTHQLRWRCRQQGHPDHHHGGQVVDGWTLLERKSSNTVISNDAVLTKPSKPSVSSPGNAFGPASTWKTIVQEYTARLLTDPRDKLLAISAVARKYQGLVDNDEYVAGLWRKDMANLLLWQGDAKLPPSPEYLAPSWSWASVLGPISFRYPYDVPIDFEVTRVELRYLAPHDPYGRIAGGYLEVKAKVAEAVPWPIRPGGREGLDQHVAKDSVYLRAPDPTDDGTSIKYARMGFLDHYDEGGTVLREFCKEGVLLLGLSDADINGAHHGQVDGLMLHGLPDGTFRRVGVHRPDFFTLSLPWEERILRIV